MQDVFARNMEKIQKPTRSLKPITVGQYVVLQNQNGPHPLRWDRTGIVVECKDYDQYLVKVHGSNRLTLRNRRFLRAYDPPANINKHFIFSPSHEDQEYSMNKGAGNQSRPADDVHFSIPSDSTERDRDRVLPRETSESNVTAPSAPNPEPTIHVDKPAVEPVRPVTVEHDPPAVRVGSSPPRQEAGIRRSSRATKGKTSMYKDYLTGNEIGEL